jgi:hypothetical protein
MEFLKDHYVIQNELLLIFISVLLGIFIGTEREYRNKSAGLRTFILVCFGSCLFTILSIKIGLPIRIVWLPISLPELAFWEQALFLKETAKSTELPLPQLFLQPPPSEWQSDQDMFIFLSSERFLF